MVWNKTYDFQTQLQLGNRAEELFLQHYHRPLIIHPGRKADFQCVETGQLVELKTDTYNMAKTPNFFFERWSNVATKKPGGPWQSRKNRVPRFVYMFARHNTYFEFPDVKLLCKALDKHIKTMPPLSIKNRGWVTVGYAVPRTAVAHLYKEYTFETDSTSPGSIFNSDAHIKLDSAAGNS